MRRICCTTRRMIGIWQVVDRKIPRRRRRPIYGATKLHERAAYIVFTVSPLGTSKLGFVEQKIRAERSLVNFVHLKLCG
jgi:hypothetical protein